MDAIYDYVFTCKVKEPSPPVDTGFLHKVFLVLKPKDDTITKGAFLEYTSATQLAEMTDELHLDELFNGGLTSIYATFVDTIEDIAPVLDEHSEKFFSIIIGSGFTPPSNTSTLLSDFEGVTYICSTSETLAAEQAQINRRSAYYKTFQNLYYIVAQFLSASKWNNLQLITTKVSDTVTTQKEAIRLQEKMISFSITGDQTGNRLAFFVCGNKRAIIAPYIQKQFQIALQQTAFDFIYKNSPQYTDENAKALGTQLDKVGENYIEQKLLNEYSITVKTEKNNFIFDASITVKDPNALWRTVAMISQEA